MDLISSDGGAMLEFLAKSTLPGIQAIVNIRIKYIKRFNFFDFYYVFLLFNI